MEESDSLPAIVLTDVRVFLSPRAPAFHLIFNSDNYVIWNSSAMVASALSRVS